MLDKRKVTLVQVAKRKLDMSEQDYRALLLRTGGVHSTTDLSEKGFNAVMAEFQRLGFVSTSAQRKASTETNRAPGRPTEAQMSLLSDWAQKAGYGGLDDPRFIQWMKVRARVEHPNFLDMAAAQRVIGALGNWLGRSQGKST
ncbi:regulatory protein GemA [Chitinimonas naiadis]